MHVSMKCIHCGGPVDRSDEPQLLADDHVLAPLVESPGDARPSKPGLCRDCACLLPSERERHAEFYCLWCRRPLADDGQTARRDAAPLPTDSDECVMFRECKECKQERGGAGPSPLLQPRPR